MIAYSVVYGTPDLIGYQKRCLEKFCPSVSELVICNNGPDRRIIGGACQTLGLRCLRGPGCAHPSWPSMNHAMGLNFLWQAEAAASPESSLFIDMDMFPVKPSDPVSWLWSTPSMAGIEQVRGGISYPWPGLLAVRHNMPDREEINFTPGDYSEKSLDTGGGLARYLDDHQEVKIRWLSDLDTSPWWHHRNITNWENRPRMEENLRLRALIAVLEKALA